MKISLSNLKNIELDKKKTLIIVIISLAIIYGDFSFLMKLQFDSIKNTSPKVTRLKKDLEKLDNDLKKIKELKSKQLEASKKILAKAKRMVSEEQETLLLEDISNLANKNDVRILQIKPSSEKPKQGKTASVSKFSQLTISLDLICDYHHLGKLINDLENSDIFFEVQSLKVSASPTDSSRQNVNLVVITYLKK